MIRSLQQCIANIWIFEYIWIIIDKYIHRSQYSLHFRTTNVFGHSFIVFLEFLQRKYSNIFKKKNNLNHRQINSYSKFSWYFKDMNLFSYSFVKRKLHSLHTGPQRHLGAIFAGGDLLAISSYCTAQLLLELENFDAHPTARVLSKFTRKEI